MRRIFSWVLVIVFVPALLSFTITTCFASDPYADIVISFTPGPGGQGFPEKTLGPPDFSSNGLGFEGSIVLGFANNILIDGPGADLAIYECTGIEEAEILVSSDSVTFVSVGIASSTNAVPRNPPLDGSWFFDIAGTGLSSVVAVKVVDLPPPGYPYITEEFDLDAVEALNWRPVPVGVPEFGLPAVLVSIIAFPILAFMQMRMRRHR